MKYSFPLLLSLTIATALLTACGGGGGSPSSGSASTPPSTVAGVATPSAVSVVTAN